MRFTKTAKLRRIVLAPVLCIILAASGEARSEASSEQELTAELAVAKSLEHAIRGSDQLGLITKLVIKGRLDEVRTATRKFRDGKIPRYDLRTTFDSAMIWLESILDDADQALRAQLVAARPALWKIAVSRKYEKDTAAPTLIRSMARRDKINR